MQEQLNKLKAKMTPEQRVDGLGKTFDMVAGHMVDHMRYKGGDPMLPLRERENIDYVSVYSSGEGDNLRAIDLYASNMWWIQHGETREPFGMVGDVTPDIMLRLYAPLKDDELMRHVEATVPDQLGVILSTEKSDDEKKVALTEHVDLAIAGYIDAHKEELMEELIRDMSKAFNKVLDVPSAQ